MVNNYMQVKFKAISENESLARAVVSAFALKLNPTLEDINDIKTAVSEAVTNCVVHAYSDDNRGDIEIICRIENQTLFIDVLDSGIGIENFEKVKEPFYTTKPDQERSGMGFAVMESFMDSVNVASNNGKGVRVSMQKRIGEEIKEAICE
jgi:stage II sporulation protein AB (anti-sigma F factor)